MEALPSGLDTEIVEGLDELEIAAEEVIFVIRDLRRSVVTLLAAGRRA